MIKLDMLPNYSKKEFERIFSENIGKCAPKNKEILEDYLLNRMTFEEIAEKTGLSKDRVYKVVKEYEKKLTCGVGSPDISWALFD